MGQFSIAVSSQVAFAVWTPSGTALWSVGDTGPARVLVLLSGVFGVRELCAVGDKLYLVARTSAEGEELWVSDGTPGNTRLVFDIFPGTGSAEPRELTAFRGRVWFRATDPVGGVELWTSDGTAAGTRRFVDLVPGTGSSRPRYLTTSGDFLYCSAGLATGSDLWRTDGTVAGSRVVGLRSLERSVGPLLSLGDGRLVFWLHNSVEPRAGYTDGTAANTRLLCQFPDPQRFAFLPTFTRVGDRIAFFGRSFGFGQEVYQLPTFAFAQAFQVGDSCADGGELAATLPVLGQTATVRGQQATGQPMVALLGIPATAPIGLPFGFPCPFRLGLTTPIANLGSSQARAWMINVAIPNDPRLLGGSVMLQSLRVSPASSTLAATNAVRWIIGR